MHQTRCQRGSEPLLPASRQVVRPVTFPMTLDVYPLCSDGTKKVLEKGRTCPGAAAGYNYGAVDLPTGFFCWYR